MKPEIAMALIAYFDPITHENKVVLSELLSVGEGIRISRQLKRVRAEGAEER